MQMRTGLKPGAGEVLVVRSYDVVEHEGFQRIHNVFEAVEEPADDWASLVVY